MTDAATGTRWGEVTRAVRPAQTPAGPCSQGDVLGLAEGLVVVVGDEVERVACELLALMLGSGGELVTVLTGLEAAEGLADGVASYVGRAHPAVELLVYDGGQPHYPLLLGVE